MNKLGLFNRQYIFFIVFFYKSHVKMYLSVCEYLPPTIETTEYWSWN